MSLFSNNDNKKILFCRKCNQAYGGNPKEMEHCPNCFRPLFNTDIDVSIWRQKDDSEKDAFKQKWANLLEKKENDIIKFHEAEYEYDVVTLINKNGGYVDRIKLNNILSDHAKAGWKLHTIYSNELGKNALVILGFGLNETVSEDIIVFERKIKK